MHPLLCHEVCPEFLTRKSVEAASLPPDVQFVR